MSFDKRLKLLFSITVIFFIYGLWHIFVLQILRHNEFKKIAEKQISRKYSIKGKRGKILTATGEEIAYDVINYNIILNPKKLSERNNLDEILKTLNKYISFSTSDLKKEILKKGEQNRKYYNMKRFLSEEEKENLSEDLRKIDALSSEIIYFKGYNKRIYANEKIFRHIVGFLGYSAKYPEKLVGKYGIEKVFDENLSGRTQKIVKYVSANRKKELPVITKKDNKKSKLNANGSNVVLTIDYMMQYILNDELEEFMKEYTPKWGAGIILNPQNGEILALASFPIKEKAYTRNAVIQNIYEPGSVMKPLIVAEAFEEHLVNENEIFHNPDGKIKKYNITIRDSSGASRGDLTPADILIKSSNVGMVEVGEKIPNKIFEEYLKKYGFYDKTGVELYGEIKINQTPEKKWDGLKKYSMSFGQAIAVTPLQMAVGFASVINGGKLYSPTIFKQLEDFEGNVIVKNKPEMIRRVISEETSKKIRDILIRVVSEGTGRKAQIKNYTLGGKTGTSQKSEGGKYSEDKFILSFAGFYPKDNPTYLCLVVSDEPKTKKSYGGQLMAPLFKKITKRIFRYKNIVPDKGEKIVIPSKIEKIREEIKFELKTMPELKGLSAREVLDVFKDTDKKVTLEGTGNVISQEPEYGIDMKKVKEIKVKLKE